MLKNICFFIAILIFSTNNLLSQGNNTVTQTLNSVNIKDCIQNCLLFYQQYPDSTDPLNFFKPFSNKVVNIFVDSVVYNKDRTIGFVFFVIQSMREKMPYFDGKAVFVYCDKTDGKIKIYPVKKYGYGSRSKSETFEALNRFYSTRMGNEKDNMGNLFVCNVGDEEFWEKSLFFKRVTNGCYYFQTIFDYKLYQNTRREEYILIEYPTCQ